MGSKKRGWLVSLLAFMLFLFISRTGNWGSSSILAMDLISKAKEKRWEKRRSVQPPVSLPSGVWKLNLPAGYRYTAGLRKIRGKRYRLTNAVRFSGVYELRGSQFKMIKGDSPREYGFVWELRQSGALVLVQQRPISKIGSDYRGSTLNPHNPRNSGPSTRK